MPCSCGFTSNKDNTCNGNHKVVRLVKDSIIKNIEHLDIETINLTPLELKELIIKIIKESK